MVMLSRKAMMGRWGAAIDPKPAALLAKFQGAGDRVAIFREDTTASGSADSLYLCQHIGAQRYWCVELVNFTVAARACHSLRYAQLRRPVVSVNQTDPSVTLSGTWTPQSVAGFYGGNGHVSSTSGDYVEFTTPDGATCVGVRIYTNTVSGLHKVTVDGDPTAAHLLPTAQDFVDAGTYPNTILTENGGAFNPTDRALDCWAGVSAQDWKLLLADNLAPGEHTVRLTLTSHTRGTDTRLYITGYSYATADTTIDTEGVALARAIDLVATGSVYEYALRIQPSGGDHMDYVGNGHGYETETSLAITLDGEPITLNNGDLYAGAALAIARTSNLYHQDVGAGATPIADGTLTYTMHPARGLDIEYTIDWDIDAQTAEAYAAMYPLSEMLDKGSGLETPADYALTDNNGSFKANAAQQAVYVWDSDGNLGAVLSAYDLATTVNDWAAAPTYKFVIEDRAGGAINKIYLHRANASPGEVITPDSVWQAKCNYRVHYFADADGVLAKGA